MQLNCNAVIARLLEFDAATLYEAAGQRGMVDPAIRPAWAGARLAGIAATVECPAGDNLMLHHAVANARPGVVLVAAAGAHLAAGAWGEILTAAAQQRGVAGLAIDGAVRDIDAIAERRFPVFSRGLAIGACSKQQPGALDVPISLGGVTVRTGDLVVGNSDGLVVIERERAREVYAAAVQRREREMEILDQLRRGKTTLELLGLPPVSTAEPAAPQEIPVPRRTAE
jgi:4-hydroxy-4-methyl-2-oxoglutarate aldolase